MSCTSPQSCRAPQCEWWGRTAIRDGLRRLGRCTCAPSCLCGQEAGGDCENRCQHSLLGAVLWRGSDIRPHGARLLVIRTAHQGSRAKVEAGEEATHSSKRLIRSSKSILVRFTSASCFGCRRRRGERNVICSDVLGDPGPLPPPPLPFDAFVLCDILSWKSTTQSYIGSAQPSTSFTRCIRRRLRDRGSKLMVLFGSGLRVAAMRAVSFDMLIGLFDDIGDEGLPSACWVRGNLSPLADGTVARRMTEGEKPPNLAASSAIKGVPSTTSRACSTGGSCGDARDPISVGLSVW